MLLAAMRRRSVAVIEPEHAQLAVEGRAVDPQDLRGPALVARRDLERLLDEHLLRVLEVEGRERDLGAARGGGARPGGRSVREVRGETEPQLLDADLRSRRERDPALDDVLELADVARPR